MLGFAGLSCVLLASSFRLYARKMGRVLTMWSEAGIRQMVRLGAPHGSLFFPTLKTFMALQQQLFQFPQLAFWIFSRTQIPKNIQRCITFG